MICEYCGRSDKVSDCIGCGSPPLQKIYPTQSTYVLNNRDMELTTEIIAVGGGGGGGSACYGGGGGGWSQIIYK